jgi:hypothetical protein
MSDGNATRTRHLLHRLQPQQTLRHHRHGAARGPGPDSPDGLAERCAGRELQGGWLAKYGLDYESLKALNPRLIYCSVTGFGQDGPYAERAGYDLMIQAMTGMMDITGRADGTPGGGPQRWVWR